MGEEQNQEKENHLEDSLLGDPEMNLQISSRTNLHSKSKNSSCHPPLFHKRKEERKMKVEQWSSKNDFRNQQNEDEKKIGNHTSWAFLSFFLKPYAGGEFSLIPDEHITAWFLMSAAKKIMKEKQQTSTGNRLNHYNKVRDKMEPAKKVVQQIP